MASHLTLDLSNLIQKQMVVVRLTFARKMLRVFKSLTIDFQSHFKYSMIMTNGVRHDDSWNDLEQSIELWRTNNDDIISLKIVFFLNVFFNWMTSPVVAYDIIQLNGRIFKENRIVRDDMRK